MPLATAARTTVGWPDAHRFPVHSVAGPSEAKKPGIYAKTIELLDECVGPEQRATQMERYLGGD